MENFIEWFAKRAGENYGYNVETSTEKQIRKEEMNQIYQLLWRDYGINDLYLISEFCEHCKGYNEKTPYHLDTNTLLNLRDEQNLNRLNKNVWTEQRINEELEKWDEIQNAIKAITPKKDAFFRKEAHYVANIIRRTKAGLEHLNSVEVQKDFVEMMNALNDSRINKILEESKDVVIVKEKLDIHDNYKLVNA
jgi:hypothetical protein